MTNATMDRALKLAVATGLRSALGPALLARARNRPERKTLALLAMGEMLADKLPMVPGRDSLLPLAARGAVGAWVAAKVADEEPGEPDPWAAPLGAAVAIGVGVAAAKLRRALGWSTGVSQPMLGLIEDYLALKLGTEAVGLSVQDATDAAGEALEDLRGRLPAEWPGLKPAQSAGAGSM